VVDDDGHGATVVRLSKAVKRTAEAI